MQLSEKLGSFGFLQEVIGHMDCKLNKGEVTVIPVLAKMFLSVDAFDSIDIHCLSRDSKKENVTSTNVEDFFNFSKCNMTE